LFHRLDHHWRPTTSSGGGCLWACAYSLGALLGALGFPVYLYFEYGSDEVSPLVEPLIFLGAAFVGANAGVTVLGIAHLTWFVLRRDRRIG
jgi:hypothetical protein